MKLLILLLTAAFATFGLSLSGQNIKNYYVSRQQENGTIYHIFPLTLFSEKQSGDLTMDITHLDHSDTTTVNFTYYHKTAAPADSLTLVAGDWKKSYPIGKIYIEPDKKNWVHRYSLLLPQRDLETFFGPDQSPQIILPLPSGRTIYSVNRSDWNKHAPAVRSIFAVIAINAD